MMHALFQAFLIYMAIGSVVLSARIAYDGVMAIRKLGLQLATARGVGLLPAILVLLLGMLWLLFMAAFCWPFTARRLYLNWRMK